MRAFLCAVLLFLFFGTVARAAEIRGRVVSAQGMPVPGAKVSLEKEGGNFHQEMLTKADGTYELQELRAGIYTITVTGPGGQPAVRRDVIVGTPDSSVRMDLRLPATVEQAADAREEGNPNIFVYRIDLNALRKRLTLVRGADPQYIREFLPEQNYFGSEFGAPLREFAPLSRRPVASYWTSSVSESFETNLLNARPFFAVGPLRPSRAIQYQMATGGPLVSNKLSLTARFGRLHDSGEVNGNVQVPLAEERAPRTTDPQARAIVGNLLRAYPPELPNLPQVSERQLNTNAPQRISSTDGLLRLDFTPRDNSSVAFRYSISDYSEDPFELLIGKNPQTDLRNQGAHLSLTHTVSPRLVGRVGFHFDRTKALLELTRRFTDLLAPLGIGAVVPDVDFKGDTFQDLGPGKIFPRRRFQNVFHLYGDLTKSAGRHSLQMGWGTVRVQVNDLQSDNSRGTLIFSADFGNTEVQNFLLAKPSQLILSRGNLYRGFRSWEHSLYFGDQIRLTPTFTLSLGLRYELTTAPTEVNGLTSVGYSTDTTNLAPRFGFAWNPRRGDTTLRGGYGISYGSVFPVTYQFARFNPPAIRVLEIQEPNITNLFSLPAQEPRTALNLISPDLVTPYSHQYTLAVERNLPGSFFLRLAYIGMRSFHLFNQDVYNRARASTDPALPNTTKTIDQRRPDPRYASITQIESNSISYYDAAQITVDKRLSDALAFRVAYTFSKNIDLGGDFTNTASGVETPPEIGVRSSELVTRVGDLKSWSLFDTPHALTLSYSYALPSVSHITGWKALLLRDWEISGTTLFQSGTPWHPHSVDGPGLGNVDGVVAERPNLLNPQLLGASFDNPDTAPSLLGADTCLAPPPFLRCKYFDTNFPPGGSGNIGYNVFRKDGANNWNVSIAKSFRFRRAREAAVQFRVSFYNLFNHPQFDKPGFFVSSPFFGKITNTVNEGRVTQLSVRVSF